MRDAAVLVQECLDAIARLREELPPEMQIDMDVILKSVAVETGVSWREILGRNRSKYVSRARMLFCLRAYSTKRWSMEAIGNRLGRDHSTVVYLIQQAKKRGMR